MNLRGMTMLYEEMGRKIREERKRLKLTQDQLSEKAGISLSFLGHIERGTRKMSVDTLVKICAALNCSADEILSTGHANAETQISALNILKEALRLAEKNT